MKENPTNETAVIRYTTAPESYDGFGTRTLAVMGKVYENTIRRVEIKLQHLDWQECRYASGLHYSNTEDEYQRLVKCGIFSESGK